MTKELYNELMDKRVITDTKMTLDYINENKLKLEDIITVPAILAMYLRKEEIVEDNIVVDENDVIEITEVDPPTNEPVIDSVTIVETDIEETNDSDKSEDTSIEPVVDEVEAKEEVLVEETSPIVEKTVIEEKPKTKKK